MLDLKSHCRFLAFEIFSFIILDATTNAVHAAKQLLLSKKVYLIMSLETSCKYFYHRIMVLWFFLPHQIHLIQNAFMAANACGDIDPRRFDR